MLSRPSIPSTQLIAFVNPVIQIIVIKKLIEGWISIIFPKELGNIAMDSILIPWEQIRLEIIIWRTSLLKAEALKISSKIPIKANNEDPSNIMYSSSKLNKFNLKKFVTNRVIKRDI